MGTEKRRKCEKRKDENIYMVGKCRNENILPQKVTYLSRRTYRTSDHRRKQNPHGGTNSLPITTVPAPTSSPFAQKWTNHSQICMSSRFRLFFFQTERNSSQIFKKQKRNLLHKAIYRSPFLCKSAM
jgi:hypothetical protein